MKACLFSNTVMVCWFCRFVHHQFSMFILEYAFRLIRIVDTRDVTELEIKATSYTKVQINIFKL